MKLILKGILLWFTVIITVLWLMSIYNMIELNMINWCIITTTSVIITNYICYHTISYKELVILSLHNYVSKYLNNK